MEVFSFHPVLYDNYFIVNENSFVMVDMLFPSLAATVADPLLPTDFSRINRGY